MKTQYLLILLAVFSFSTPAAVQKESNCQPAASKEYLSLDGRFRICFPGVPKKLDLPYDTKIGTIVSHSFVYNTDLSYRLTYVDYPIDSVQPDAVRPLLDHARDGGLARPAGIIEYLSLVYSPVCLAYPEIQSHRQNSEPETPSRFCVAEVCYV